MIFFVKNTKYPEEKGSGKMQHPTELRIVCWRNKLEENLPNPGNRKLKRGKKKVANPRGYVCYGGKMGERDTGFGDPEKDPTGD